MIGRDMEIRDFAIRCLFAKTLDEKLARCEGPFTDSDPGAPIHVDSPARPRELMFATNRKPPAMPRPNALRNPRKRAVAHHIMANHELQALEVMALVLCVFPDAPPEFRRGLARILGDEQRHTRMHVERAGALGLGFGDLPVNGYIWKKGLDFKSILDYVAGLSLTFEGRNLDHTLEFERAFRTAGDDQSAAIMRIIHADEIEHVAFGWHWLTTLKDPNESEWQAYSNHLHWPLRPAKASGDQFHREPRLSAGMSPDFLNRLQDTDD